MVFAAGHRGRGVAGAAGAPREGEEGREGAVGCYADGARVVGVAVAPVVE